MSRVFERGSSALFGINKSMHILLIAALAAINALVKFGYLSMLYIIEWGSSTLLVKVLSGLRLVSAAKFSGVVVSISALGDTAVGRFGISAPFIASTSALVVLGIRGSPARASLTYLLLGLGSALQTGSYLQLLATPLFLISKYILNKVAGSGALDAFNGYINTVLRLRDDGTGSILRVLTRLEKRCIEVHIFRVCGTSWAIIVSNIHPGPFGRIGSGDLPSLILREGRSRGIETIFLHGYGSHELDLVDRDVAMLAAKIIASEAATCSPCRSLAHIPNISERGSVRVIRFGLGGREISIVTRIFKAMDDIPPNVYSTVLRKVGGVILVDAQNVYDGPTSWDRDDVENLIKLLNERLDPCSEYVIGVGRRRVDGCGVLEGGVTSIYVRSCGKTLKLLVIDGNNIDKKVYKDLKNYFHEVLTTDNHEETGIAIGRGYRLVGEGEGCRKAVLSAALDALREAEASAQRSPICYKSVKFCARVLGEEGFKKLRELASRYSRTAVTIIATYIAIPLSLQLLQFLL